MQDNPPPSHPTDQTSQSLLERVRLRDAAAWSRLVDLYSPLVCHWCRKTGLGPEETADVVQETFLAVATHLPKFQKQNPSDTFRGWLRVIARNKIRDVFRRQHRQPQGQGGTTARQQFENLPDVSEIEISEGDRAEEQRLLLRQALELVRGEFEDVTWQAFYRVVVDGRSAQDAALDLDTTAGAVRQAKYKVLRRLRQELDEFPA
jgi:RNA polymerase sigma-70 factor (ECF subfamily)